MENGKIENPIAGACKPFPGSYRSSAGAKTLKRLTLMPLSSESAEFQSPSLCRKIKRARAMHFHRDEKSGNSCASSDGPQE
ncbi:hypothetical protein CDAR_586911 [Caerostris darwini]|uniref:Uncharacterized protein n=1 Tax=Caerostris darwini TaxID=1538125 RepID=A0AAV4VI40_9ARAC|nr:hypothetical protein CDAR_586911 [Caerostris darwini]